MKVLIVDDSTYIRNTLRGTLEEGGYEIVGEAKDGESAIDLALEFKPDIITLDNILPDMTGFDVLKTIRKNEINSYVVMISAIGQASSQEDADELGVSHYMIKPIDHQYLLELLRSVETN